MIYCVDGCIGKKHQEKGRLAILNFRGATFCLLMFLLFSCVFVVCRLWNAGVLFFMKCWCPNQKLVVECCFLDFLQLCEEDDVELLNGGRMRLVGKGNKYLTTTKAKHSSFLYSNSSQIHFVVWKLSGGMPKACDFH
jgi:hypothetical protein